MIVNCRTNHCFGFFIKAESGTQTMNVEQPSSSFIAGLPRPSPVCKSHLIRPSFLGQNNSIIAFHFKIID